MRHNNGVSLEPVKVTTRQLVWRALSETPFYSFVSIGGSAMWAIATVAWAKLLGYVTDTVIIPALQTKTIPTDALIKATALLALVGFLNGLGVFGRRYGSYTYVLTIQANHRRKVGLHYLTLPLAWHRSQRAGDLISRVSADARSATAAIAPLSMATGMVVMLVAAFWYLFTIDAVLLGVMVVTIPILVAINIWLDKRLKPLATDASAAVGDLTGAINESADAALAIKVLGRAEDEYTRIQPLTDTVRAKRTAMTRLFALYDLAYQGIPALTIFVLVAVGVLRLTTGVISAGSLVAVAFLMGMIISPLRILGYFLQEVPKSLAGVGRIDAVLAVQDRIMGGDVHITPTTDQATQGARIDVKDLTYVHPAISGDTTNRLRGIRDISLTIEPGETVAIVGKTGSGKSTLVNLLAGLLPADAGEITLDATPIQDLDGNDRAAMIATAFQAPFMFNESLEANITLGTTVSETELAEAMRVAQVHRFADDIGHDTTVGERGTDLSGGQRQRIALARALIRHPRVLLLDDATSAVDTSVEQAILSGLREARASGFSPTTVIVAYRTGSIALADRVVFMEDGQIRAIGTHEALLASDPDYAEIVHAARDDRPMTNGNPTPLREGHDG